MVLMGRAYRGERAGMGSRRSRGRRPSAPHGLLGGAAQQGSPVAHVGVAAQQPAALALGHPAPHPEVDAVVEGVGEAFGAHRASPAGDLHRMLLGALHEEPVGLHVHAGTARGPAGVGGGDVGSSPNGHSSPLPRSRIDVDPYMPLTVWRRSPQCKTRRNPTAGPQAVIKGADPPAACPPSPGLRVGRSPAVPPHGHDAPPQHCPSRAGLGFVKSPRSWHASWPPVLAAPYCVSMARTTSASSSGRSLPVALLQTLYLLLGMLAVSALAGVLLAAFFLPVVSAGSAVAEDGVDLFESYPSELEVDPLNEASRIEAADGSLLATFYTENRIMVPLEEIDENMQHAVIAVEDRRFYEHGGIDPKGMVRALASNAAGSATQGGSTLTQQYVKNALLMDAVQRGDQEDQLEATAQTYGRKLREAKLAISLEKQWSKD